jgi:integrase
MVKTTLKTPNSAQKKQKKTTAVAEKPRQEEEKKKVDEWLEELNPSQLTRCNYVWSLDAYCKSTGMMAEQLIEEADSDVRTGVLPRDRVIKKRLIAFRTELIDRGIASTTVLNYMAGPISFYRIFGHEVPRLGKRGTARPKPEHIDSPVKDDIREALKVSDLRDKAIILVGCSSGISVSNIVELTIGQFNQGYDSDTGICTLFLRRQKTGTDFVTFLNPETSQAVLDYLEQRNRTLDYIDVKKSRILEKQSWENKSGTGVKQYLFIKKLVDNEYLNTHDEELRKLDAKAVLKAYNEIADMAKKSGGKVSGTS